MQITIDTNNLSELDVAMLAFLAGQEATEEAPEPEAPAPAKPAAKKAAPKPDPEPEVEENLIGGDDGPTVADAVQKATLMVSEGKSAQVKAALAAVGANRVSEMPEDKVVEFITLLDDAE